ncbi:MAG: hypothetical protein RJA78_1007 [Actinomycetota bacterium]
MSVPSAAAEIVITRAEKITASSVPRIETESMLPQRAIRVVAIIRIDHSSSGLVVKPSSSLKREGAISKNIALRPNTVAPVAKTLLRYGMFMS